MGTHRDRDRGRRGLDRLGDVGAHEDGVPPRPVRREHRASLDVRPLAPETRRTYVERWESTQARFVDAPSLAVTEADVLVRSVMRDRGYPVEDPAQRMADVSVDHPDVMDRFRAATAIAAAARDDRASTEDLRQAMVDYRELFGRLLADEGDPRLERSA
jgi:hypothetical protein